ncbi:FAD-binding monooxygenase [Roseobacter sp. GAI101]|uniref:FAD-binding monooxygenase n=1 Tax=Roseobacter sp. (strain GAI101) TaxID=391589 RepID=UPI00018717D1|nr:FAD-binding monooxygenase [Roseobacter sp. GAI101]EEB82874.1 phenol 2-monooxygenase [Roseobacter sp. GAI101]
MQYHLNGFKSGSPDISAPSGTPHSDEPPGKVDVLIVGCGPAGLTLAAQLAAFGDISTCIIDQKSGPLQMGQADGIACRSVEMFEAFGFSERVLRESYWVNETTFWKPDADQPAHIARSGRIEDTEEGLSEMPHVILSQARVHDFYLDVMRNGPRRLEPHYDRQFVSLARDDSAEYPLTVTVSHSPDGMPVRTEAIQARYVVGCDGARSGVRRAIGRELVGDAANQAWGVMDVLMETDFPDVRLKSVIHSANEGSVLIIPREGGYLVRLYIELDKLNPDERVSHKNITQDQLIAAAGRIMPPYSLDVKEVVWWSVYEIGQRLCDRFDDAQDGADPRVFIAGDAGHTHSPKAGQGMNVSMGDAFNLGWKLAAVLRGQSAPAILHSYSTERQAIAQELIEFDRAFAKMFSARPQTGDKVGEDTVDPKEFQRYFQKQGRFTAGTSVHYAPSLVVAEGAHQHLAKGFVIGMRFHSAPVIRVADAKPLHLGHTLKADGRWRILAFAGQDGDVSALCDYLGGAGSPITQVTPEGADIDSVIDLRAVFQQGHRTVDVGKLPSLLLPKKGRYGLRDYEKVFSADPRADIFEMRGIDRDQGCLVIVRPDQYVAQVLPLTAHDQITQLFAGVLNPHR